MACEALKRLMKPEMDEAIEEAVKAALVEKEAILAEKHAELDRLDAEIRKRDEIIATLMAETSDGESFILATEMFSDDFMQERVDGELIF